MSKLCTNCLYKAKGKYSRANSFRLPLGGFILGLGFLALSIMDYSDFFDSTSMFVWIFLLGIFLTALYLIISFYSNNMNTCPKCNYGKMIDSNAPNPDSQKLSFLK